MDEGLRLTGNVFIDFKKGLRYSRQGPRSGFWSGRAKANALQLGGFGDMLPRKNFKLKSSEMARNATKTGEKF